MTPCSCYLLAHLLICMEAMAMSCSPLPLELVRFLCGFLAVTPLDLWSSASICMFWFRFQFQFHLWVFGRLSQHAIVLFRLTTSGLFIFVFCWSQSQHIELIQMPAGQNTSSNMSAFNKCFAVGSFWVPLSPSCGLRLLGHFCLRPFAGSKL